MRKAALAIALAVVLTRSATSDKYAVLVGIGSYEKPLNRLEGPPNDVAALHTLLTETYGFRGEHIRTLVNAEANRASILRELDQLVERVQPGDFVFFYFSGHGTGPKDRESAELLPFGLGLFTGAILPADVKVAESPEEVSRELIIGLRDLRPRLSALDAKATVLAVFDSCFSGDAIKEFKTSQVQARYVPFWDLVRKGVPRTIAKSAGPDPPEPPYPYRHVIYLSAASRHERAIDLSSSDDTFDGKAHGGFSNFLIQGLKGAADLNHDGSVSFEELYQYVRFWVPHSYGHSPQLLFHSAEAAILQQPVLGAGAALVKNTGAPPPRTVRLRLENAEELRVPITRIPRIVLADHDYDVVVEKRGNRYVFTNESRRNDHIQESVYSENDLSSILRRIAAQPQVFDLIEAAVPKQDFMATLAPAPDKPVYRAGETIQFESRTEKAGYAALLAIDDMGTATVLGNSDAKVAANSPIRFGGIRVRAPFGVEYVKLLVACDENNRIPWKKGRNVDPDDPDYQVLLQLFTEPAACRAQSTVRLLTMDR